MYNSVILIQDRIPAVLGKRGVLGLLFLAGERGSFIGFGVLNSSYMSHLSRERIFSFLACVQSVAPTFAYVQ
jgi:hypothetical protein